MIQLTKKVSLLGLVLSISSLGIMVGQTLTHQVVRASSAWAAPNASANIAVFALLIATPSTRLF